MPLHVPSLAKKLQCLYQRHETVNTHELLSQHLGITPNNISTWINGNEVRAPELIPNRHVKRIADLFAIPVQWLDLDSLEEFKLLLPTSPSQAGPWPQLLPQAATSDMIHLVRQEHHLEPAAQPRGLIADDTEPLEQFHVGERVYISLTLSDEWNERSQQSDVHALVLSVDRADTTCLCPSSLAPNPRLSSPTLLIPHAAPHRGLKIAGPVGPQCVVALLTNTPLEPDIYAGLRQGSAGAVLDRLAICITQTPTMSWQLLRKDYEVL